MSALVAFVPVAISHSFWLEFMDGDTAARIPDVGNEFKRLAAPASGPTFWPRLAAQRRTVTSVGMRVRPDTNRVTVQPDLRRLRRAQ